MERQGKLPDIFYFNLKTGGMEKKWNDPREDLSDYFNYGFNEDIWSKYCDFVIEQRRRGCQFTQDSGGLTGIERPELQKFKILESFGDFFFLNHACSEKTQYSKNLQNQTTALLYSQQSRQIKKILKENK